VNHTFLLSTGELFLCADFRIWYTLGVQESVVTMQMTTVIEKFPPELQAAVVDLIRFIQEERSVTREDFSELKSVVLDLSKAQKRTESRVEELADAQKRTSGRDGSSHESRFQRDQGQHLCPRRPMGPSK